MKKVYGKQVKAPKMLYHTSSPLYRKSIMKHGLIPKIGHQLYDKDNIKYRKAVYLSYSPWSSTYVDDVELSQDGKLTVWGDLEYKGDNFGWLQVSFVVNTDLAIKIIEMYMKKLGKLKTILEAAK